MKTCRQMIIEQLREMGADGLCYPGERCGCGIDDLAPCGECLNLDECVPAKWVKPKSDSWEYDEEFPDGYYKVMEWATS